MLNFPDMDKDRDVLMTVMVTTATKVSMVTEVAIIIKEIGGIIVVAIEVVVAVVTMETEEDTIDCGI
jgi:hypothetical protein